MTELVWLDNLTPKSTRFDDTYYSLESGFDETKYVFIDGNDLPKRWNEQTSPVIGELGFGTGLNFLTTWHMWQNALGIVHQSDEDKSRSNKPANSFTFVSVEKFPLEREDLSKALSPWKELSPLASQLINQWTPERPGWQNFIFGPVTLKLFIGDACDALASMPNQIDAWYLDGFNPKTNPDLWSQALMNAVAEASNSKATLASYTAAGWVRRNLAEAGFTIAKRKGFGHKRDMITGYKS